MAVNTCEDYGYPLPSS